MRRSFPFALVLLAFSFYSCKKDPPLNEPGSNEAINQWTMDQMRHYYYWNQYMREAKDYQQGPDLFFKSILFKEDRYSTILQTLNSDTYSNTLSNTFGFGLVQLQTTNKTIQLVTHVVPFSEGDLMGLKRGDSITHINNELIDHSNMQSLLSKSLLLPAMQLQRNDGKLFHLPSSYISEPVLYTAKLIHSSPAVGYMFLSQFDFSGAYSLLEAVQNFKSKQVEELVVDLRYNPGGQVAFASFCALLLADIKENDIFVKYHGNKNLKNREDSFKAALQGQPDGYSFTAADILKQGLHLQRIYLLTGPNTASAAELLINGLKPYIQIVQVGETTYGKDMASTTLTTPENIHGTTRAWHLAPMIYKIYNQAGQGDYRNGIIPQKMTDEFAFLPLLPIGDTRDPLIQEVLQTINNKRYAAQRAVHTVEKKATLTPKYMGSSYQTISIEVSVQSKTEK